MHRRETITIIEFAAHRRVHQAIDMISLQAGVEVTKASVRPPSTAATHQRPIEDIAADVVARRIRFGAPT